MLYARLFDPIIILNENQILYIFSTSAQVVAGLFGLTLTGYIFWESKLDDTVKDEITFYDSIQTLKQQSYANVKIIGILCFLSISFSLLDIGTYNAIQNAVYTYMINQTITFLIFEIVFIILFSWDVISPNHLRKISNEGKRIIEKHLKQEDSLTIKGNFTEFLKFYNMLEELTISYANELINVPVSVPTLECRKRYTPKLMDSLKILNSNEILNGKLCDEINELRQYRNYTVHSTDISVDANIVERLKQIYNALNNVYSVHDNEEKRIEAISKLYKI